MIQMPKKPETIIEDAFVDLVRESEYVAMAVKLVLFVGRGFPDRTILGNGRCFFIEFKVPGNEGLDPKQIQWKKRLEQLGMKVYVCSSSQKAFKIFSSEMESAQVPA